MDINIPENSPEGGDSRDQAGQDFRVSGKSVDFATEVSETGANTDES